ncbi:Mediator of RNA polymerase II transcription subunit 1-like protein 2 [Sarcoptes scabiei]|uniref:Mediator of RNA polymerase II transcription subunit 1 n=1 Tax=Sarcoptes scabiei TaxID=52283 RepID=A0A132AMD3_SARSC|nr:Mediator of RNA polymerase II transcription subunit 1-like protein 2 [Sarcoptes scabiei]
MKLTFFVSPYDLIDVKTKTIFPMTVDVIKEKSLGYSVTIGLEDSEQNHRLQIQSLLVVKQQNDGKNLPQFLSHTSMNSQTLPACYVLRLLRPLPICIDMIRKIYKLTGISQKFTTNNETELIALLKEQYLQSDQILSSQEDRDSSKRKSPIPFYTVLSDQSHLYYVNSLNEITDEENNEEPLSSMLIGTVVEKIPFTHPTHVPRILVFLRQQVLFNIILGSVIHSGVEIFEISYTNITNIYIQFEHPIEHSLATLEIDLKDITQVKCKIHVPGTGNNGSYSKNQPNNSLNDEFVTKVMQK